MDSTAGGATVNNVSTGVSTVSALQKLIQAALDAQPGLDVAALSRRSKLTPQLIYGWLNGTRVIKVPPRPETIAGLAKGLSVPEPVVWQAIIEDLGGKAQLVPDDLSPERAVLIASLTNLPEQEVHRVTAIVQQFMDED
jgi:transcriptional regulator with XRE-family HTH domain